VYNVRGRFVDRVSYAASCCGPRFFPRSPHPPSLAGITAYFLATPENSAGRAFLWKGRVMKKLYVGNLSYSVDDAALRDMFTAHGTVVSAQIVMDRATGRSKGFGFVEMSSDTEAQAAITALDGQVHGERAIKVNEARPREDRPRTGGFGGGGHGGYAGRGGRN
jgi:hypothetical protein